MTQGLPPLAVWSNGHARDRHLEVGSPGRSCVVSLVTLSWCNPCLRTSVRPVLPKDNEHAVMPHQSGKVIGHQDLPLQNAEDNLDPAGGAAQGRAWALR